MPKRKKQQQSAERGASDAQLFFVDKTPSAVHFAQSSTSGDKKADAQLSRTELARRRVLGVERVIAPNPLTRRAYTNVALKSNVKSSEATRIKQMRKRLAKQQNAVRLLLLFWSERIELNFLLLARQNPTKKRLKQTTNDNNNNNNADDDNDDNNTKKSYDLWGTKFTKLRHKPKRARRAETLKAKMVGKAPAVLLPEEGLSVK
jgi:hypothetical protein